MNDYYDVNIKEWRLKEIEKCLSEHPESTYAFYKNDLSDKAIIDKIFSEHTPDVVVNLADVGFQGLWNDAGALGAHIGLTSCCCIVLRFWAGY